MKTKVFFLTILFFSLLSIKIFANSQDNAAQKSINDLHLLQGEDTTRLVLSITQIIITLLGLGLTYYGINKNSEKNLNHMFLLQIKNQRANRIFLLISSLRNELEKETYTRIYQGKYASDRHQEIESKLITYLSDYVSQEKKLKDCIYKFHSQRIESVLDWINEIQSLHQEYIKSLN